VYAFAVASRGDKGNPPSASGAPEPPGFAVGHDGKIDGIYRPPDSRRTWTPTDAARLELAEREPKTDPIPDLPPRAPPPPRNKMLALAIIVGALLLPFAAVWGFRLVIAWRTAPAKASGLIVIDSVPTNARLFINGKEVGRTPYVAPNTFEPGSTISASVVYPGAQVWTGTFAGGVDTSFTAELQSVELQPK
jgi:hypothetical protein